jgi:hypothetical protein
MRYNYMVLASLSSWAGRRNAVHSCLSVNQPMPCLRPRRGCHLHLEFRRERKVPWNFIPGNDGPAAPVTLKVLLRMVLGRG